MWLFIKPIDTVCCRDGRPFIAGESVTARTVFPPFPSTFYGALRTALLTAKGKSLNQFHQQKEPFDDLPEVGVLDRFGELRITGPWLAKKDPIFGGFQFLFPTPSTLVREKDNTHILHKLLPGTAYVKADVVSNLNVPLSLILGPADRIVKRCEGYIGFNGVQKMLWQENETPDYEDLYKVDDYSRGTWQVGLTRKYGARVAAEGRLYSIEHRQMPFDCGFFLKIEGTEQLSPQGLLKIGGEWRAAKYEIIDEDPFQESQLERTADLILKNRQFFLWLITPAMFENGYLPGFIEPSTLEGTLANIAVRLAACQIPQKQFIGGFKLGAGAGGESKTGYWAVPAGAVYFFQITSEPQRNEIVRLVRQMMFDVIAEQKKNMAAQGFGTCLIGGYENV